jgi:hypothetical protein
MSASKKKLHKISQLSEDQINGIFYCKILIFLINFKIFNKNLEKHFYYLIRMVMVQ